MDARMLRIHAGRSGAEITRRAPPQVLLAAAAAAAAAMAGMFEVGGADDDTAAVADRKRAQWPGGRWLTQPATETSRPRRSDSPAASMEGEGVWIVSRSRVFFRVGLLVGAVLSGGGAGSKCSMFHLVPVATLLLTARALRNRNLHCRPAARPTLRRRRPWVRSFFCWSGSAHTSCRLWRKACAAIARPGRAGCGS